MKITLTLVPQNQHITKIFFQNAKNCQCKMTADIKKEDVVISRNDQDLKLGLILISILYIYIICLLAKRFF